ncbi:hypothetical protein EYB45_00575 [Erythrobacteraceae bacterium CFH 75059]|uniref:hypothetical protein n=1 Tax=Qipengyuania thermophila TaxID=2509361 RepID=UPI001020EF25|nr:hypothetical protein [Qipengyuania thermophila]TCD06274.1 hypothetical protein EYB45_00575 [Erythrobacteraceae bacterium CFH 75059]
MDGSLNSRSFLAFLLPLFAVAACIYVFAGLAFFYRSDVQALDYDEWEYWQLSAGLIEGRFDDPGRRTLGFPALLAALRMVSDDFLFVQIAVSVIAATAPPLLSVALRRNGASRSAALLAGTALTLWPPQIFIAASLYSETLALPLLLSALAVMPRTGGSSHAARWLAAGLLLGALAHVRTMYQLLMPIVLLMVWLECGQLRSAARNWLLVMAGFALAVLPWSIHVSHKLGTPVLLTANGGETMAGGLNPVLLSTSEGVAKLERRSTWTGPGKWLPVSGNGYLSAEEQDLPYTEQDRLLQRRTFEWIASAPAAAAYLTLRKLAYQWTGYPWRNSELRQILFASLPIIALVVTFLIAVWRHPRMAREQARFALMPLFVIGVALISWGSWRFRQPADAAMIAIVACALVSSLRRDAISSSSRIASTYA